MVKEDEIEIIGYSGSGGEIIIPSVIEEKPVTSIGKSAFQAKVLTKVEIPVGVRSIGESAFASNQLTSLLIPEGVTSIGKFAFQYNDLISVKIPESIQKIERAAFSTNALESLTIPAGLSHISDSVFSGNSLTKIVIPEGITSIGASVFSNNPIKSAVIAKSVTSMEEFIFYINGNSSPDLVIYGEIGSKAEEYAKHHLNNNKFRPFVSIDDGAELNLTLGKTKTLSATVLPEDVVNKNVSWLSSDEAVARIDETGLLTPLTYGETTITVTSEFGGYQARSKVTIKKEDIDFDYKATGDGAGIEITNYKPVHGGHVIIPPVVEGKPVTSIGNQAFYKKGLNSIKIPNTVTNIGWGAFMGNTAMTSITIPESVQNIQGQAFSENLNLSSVVIEGPAIIGDKAFYNNKISNLVLHEGVTSIGFRAFYINKMTSIIIPGSVQSIGNEAFSQNYGVKNVVIRDGVKSIGDQAFYNNQIVRIVIPKSVTAIGAEVFQKNHSSMTIYGEAGSAAAIYASNNGHEFRSHQSALDSLVGIPPTSISTADGKIKGTIDLMEYKLASASEWQSAAETETGGLRSGTYEVRISPEKIGIDLGVIKKVSVGPDIYTVSFVDEDGRELDKQRIADGATPKYKGESPTKAATAEFTYTFAGWTPELSKVSADALYKATYNAKRNNYNVTFVDEDGRELDKQKLAYGASPKFAGASPTKAGDAQYTYTFAGWTPEVSEVREDALYKVAYSVKAKSYSVSFEDYDGSELAKSSVEYGSGASAPANPTRKGYTFTGWDTGFDDVKKDLTVRARYTVNNYNVTFVDEDGRELDKQKLAYGASPKFAGASPTKAGDAQYTYTFAGWTPEVSKVREDALYKVAYSVKAKSYSVSFEDYDGSELARSSVEYGSGASAPANPTRKGYTFTGWDTGFDDVKKDLTVRARYTRNINTVSSADKDTKIREVSGDNEKMAELAQSKLNARTDLADFVNANDYKENADILRDALSAGNEAIKEAATIEDVKLALEAAKKEVEKIEPDTKLEEETLIQEKSDAISKLRDYLNSEDYQESEDLLKELISKGNKAIDSARTLEEVEEALSATLLAMDELKSDQDLESAAAQESTKEADTSSKTSKVNIPRIMLIVVILLGAFGGILFLRLKKR